MKKHILILFLFLALAGCAGAVNEKPYLVKIKYKSGREYLTSESDITAKNDSLAYVQGVMLILSHMKLEENLRKSGSGMADYSDVVLDVYDRGERNRWVNHYFSDDEKDAIHLAVYTRLKSSLKYEFPFEDIEHLGN